MILPTFSAIIRRHYKNIKDENDKTEEEVSGLFHILLISPDNGRDCRPKTFAFYEK